VPGILPSYIEENFFWFAVFWTANISSIHNSAAWGHVGTLHLFLLCRRRICIMIKYQNWTFFEQIYWGANEDAKFISRMVLPSRHKSSLPLTSTWELRYYWFWAVFLVWIVFWRASKEVRRSFVVIDGIAVIGGIAYSISGYISCCIDSETKKRWKLGMLIVPLLSSSAPTSLLLTKEHICRKIQSWRLILT